MSSTSTISANMNLVIPTVGQEPGPQYASDVNSSLTIIDQHTHAAGSGVLITPLAMNINSNLTFGGNFATNVAGVTFSTQSSTPANKTIYNNGSDLYFVDALGNNIRLTQSGAVAGTSGSIANLVPPASASYQSVGAKFVWQSNVNIAANMDFASAVLRNISPNSTFGLTLAPPAALAADYTITLPALPGSNLPLSINSSGTMSAATITGTQISSATITGSNIAAATITGSNIAAATIADSNIVAATITNDKLAAVNIQMSAGTNVVISSLSYTNITNLQVTITTVGRPVVVGLQSINGASQGILDTNTGGLALRLVRDSTNVSSWVMNENSIQIPGSSIMFIDTGGTSAGPYTYTMQGKVLGTGNAGIADVVLFAYEL